MSDNVIDDLEKSLDEEARNLMTLRTSIVGAMDKKVLVNYIRELVQNSEIFKFSSDRASRFISMTRPQLDLLMDAELAYKQYPKLDLFYTQNYTIDTEQVNRDRAAIIHEKLVTPISNLALAAIFFVIEGSFPEYLKQYEAIVCKLFEHRKAEDLCENIVDIVKKVRGDTVLYQFIVGNISAITFSDPADTDNADGFTLELIL